MMRCVIVLIALFSVTRIYSQYRVSGVVNSEESRPMTGAHVVIQGRNYGTTTDDKGYFSFEEVPAGTYVFQVSFVGYKTFTKEISVNNDLEVQVQLSGAIIRGEEIIVRSTRAGENTPVTYSVVNKTEIEKNNLGQDLPFLLGMEPSVVYTSDAGAGVGYTGLWIRGSNIQRINVTVNGVPLNDPESHGVFWVNMPDFVSSVQSAQVQRGVGTSTNGGGAFGATINLETDHASDKAFAEINSSWGSFNTFKNNLRFGTGKINDKWAFEGRASKITSDGYIDRAASDLKSYFLQGGYYGEHTTVKAILFSGKEKTYQAWNGIDKISMEQDRTYNSCGAIYDESWNVTGFYDNETDNYQQDHYQLHFTQHMGSSWLVNSSIHYTYGRGYYEQYYSNEYLGDYQTIGIQYSGYDSTWEGDHYNYYYHDSVTGGDMIVRRWLDNDFYGFTCALNYQHERYDVTLGGAWNQYADAKHFGELLWSEYPGNYIPGERFYNNKSFKSDMNAFLKIHIRLPAKFSIFSDIQIRRVWYTVSGIDKGNVDLNIDKTYLFFNPKAGINYDAGNAGIIYASYALANREPVRTDFIDAPLGVVPEHELLQNVEVGIRKNSVQYYYCFNGYLMSYSNQLVLTGEINDVGYPIRENVGKSIRYGLELDGMIEINKYIALRANLALAESRTDFMDMADTLVVEYSDVRLPFSPVLVSGYELIGRPFRNSEISFTGKYVSLQYLDMTGSKRKSLDPFYTNNLRIRYKIETEKIKQIMFSLLVNNLWNTFYTSNGYVYDDEPYYYPQAGINFMAGITIGF